MKKRAKKKGRSRRLIEDQKCSICRKRGHNARSHKRGSVKGLK